MTGIRPSITAQAPENAGLWRLGSSVAAQFRAVSAALLNAETTTLTLAARTGLRRQIVVQVKNAKKYFRTSYNSNGCA